MTPSIFLVGPTPRKKDVKSWRPEALRLLEELEFNGHVFIPENREGTVRNNYDNQADWERQALEMATVIAAWVPRELDTMPAFTTNVEFGRYVTSKRLIYGRPEGSPNNGYLDWLYLKETGLKPKLTLRELLVDAVFKANSI